MGCGMGRPPRFIPPGATVEVAARTIGGRFLLRPGPEMNAAILGTLGRALHLYPLDLHAFTFLSNHWHALVTVPDAELLANFLGHVHGNIARAANRIHDWTGPVWKRRAETINVIDDESAEARLRYVLSQGAKEGLVASPLDWPGVSSTRALAFGAPLVGYWRDGRLAAQRSRGGRIPHASDIMSAYPIDLAPLPAWSGIAEVQRQQRVREVIREIEEDARRRHFRPLGPAAILGQDPHAVAADPESGPPPDVHAATQRSRSEFLIARRAFMAAYAAASQSLRARPAPHFPRGAFPPHAGFVHPEREEPVTLVRAGLATLQRARDRASASESSRVMLRRARGRPPRPPPAAPQRRFPRDPR